VLTKNLTNFLFATKAASRRPPQREMTCIVRAAFAIVPGAPLAPLEHLDQGALSFDSFAEDDDECSGACLAPGDFADFKLGAEVLLKGSCHTPGGRALTECPVHFGVGDWSKSIRVVGPRQWGGATGDAPSNPTPFTTMPITWANAFGGPGFEPNPVGRGVVGPDVPSLEYPGAPVRSRADRNPPATFGPINPYWPARASLVGKEYGPAWRKKRMPYYAEDFDYRHFFSAPKDQRLERYLRGDEEVTFQNLHPTAQVLTVQLPGLRVRVFVKGKDARFREVAMSLDTLFADLDAGKLYLTWRGLDAVAEDDLSDVGSILIASEKLGESVASESYRATLEEFERDPVGLDGKLPSAAQFKGTPTADDVDPVSRMLAEKGVPEEDRVPVRKAMADLQKLENDKVDLEAIVASVNEERPPAFVPIKPGTMPPMGLKANMRALLEQVANARAELAKKREELEKSGQKVEMDTAPLDAAERVPHDPRLSQLDPSYSFPEPLSTDEPGPGRNLAEHDLRGRDLRGADLRGANLQAADLSKADLRGAQLQGANLRFAVLWKANAEGADFTGADLTLTHAAGLVGTRASFRKAKLETASFEAALLEEAIFDEAEGTYVIFTKAALSKASFVRALLSSSDFDEAVLRGAVLREATIEKALFARADLTGADLSRAKLNGTSFADATCDRASFADAFLARALFTKASLSDARFAGAFLYSAMFERAKAPGTSFVAARARGARFERAVLDSADFSRADLMGADFCKAQLLRSSFRDASLYDAKLLGAAGDKVDFVGADLTRALITES
jgi:uncharacterized protein YjbI with pentapeptide repeats